MPTSVNGIFQHLFAFISKSKLKKRADEENGASSKDTDQEATKCKDNKNQQSRSLGDKVSQCYHKATDKMKDLLVCRENTDDEPKSMHERMNEFGIEALEKRMKCNAEHAWERSERADEWLQFAQHKDDPAID